MSSCSKYKAQKMQNVLPKIDQWSIITLSRGTDVVDTEVLQQWLHLWTTEECLKTCYTYDTVYTHNTQLPAKYNQAAFNDPRS